MGRMALRKAVWLSGGSSVARRVRGMTKWLWMRKRRFCRVKLDVIGRVNI